MIIMQFTEKEVKVLLEAQAIVKRIRALGIKKYYEDNLTDCEYTVFKKFYDYNIDEIANYAVVQQMGLNEC